MRSANYLDSRRKQMSIITKSDYKSVLEKASDNFVSFKEKYCPDGQTCDDIMSLSLLAFTVWFMYVAMQPIM